MSPLTPGNLGPESDDREDTGGPREKFGEAEPSEAFLIDDQFPLLRLEAAVDQFCNNLTLADGWDGEPLYDSPEIWTMRGYLEQAEATDGVDLPDRFNRAWATVEEVTANRLDDSDLIRTTRVLLKSHLLNQVAVSLVTIGVRTEVEQTRHYVASSLMEPFHDHALERSRNFPASPSDASSPESEAGKRLFQLRAEQQREAEVTVQMLLRSLITLGDALPLLIDGALTEHRVSYMTELAIPEGFYDKLQADLEALFAEPLEEVIRQTCDQGLRKMEWVLKETGFLPHDDALFSSPSSFDLVTLEPRWQRYVSLRDDA